MPKVARVPQWDPVRDEPAKLRPEQQRADRYFAFLSYSHRDEATAKWLHEALEQFRVPPALAGRVTSNGVVPKRLRPIFRDRGELPAADDLGAEIRQALAASRFLIVICSPAAAQSRWANAEIEAFKKVRPDGCVLAAIVDGEPFASDTPGRETEECLPPALRHKYDRRGRATGKRAEPLAADLRDDRDGKRVGFLKIVAGMLGIGLDELVQRETLRRQKRLAMIAAASLAGMVVTSTLAVVAVDARDAARDQRREAEGLVGFMLGDLRTRLEPLGRLDVLDSVGSRALGYYQSQDKGSLSDESLAQRSKALTLMGEIANTRGDLDRALRLYREALAGTEEALRRVPDDPKRMFDHAQNVFWVGYIDYQRGRLDRASAAFREYKRLALAMIATEPDSLKWRLEQAYADNNLGVVLIKQRHYREATATFGDALAASEALLAAEPDSRENQDRLVEALAWLADAREKTGQLDDALAQRERQLGLIARLNRSRGADPALTRTTMTAHRAVGRLFASRGDSNQGLKHMLTAAALADELIRTEPGNTEWSQFGAETLLELGQLQLAVGLIEAAGISGRAGCYLAGRLAARDPSVVEWGTGLRGRCLGLRARLALAAGAPAEAQAHAAELASVARAELARGRSIDAQFALVEAEMLRGEAALRVSNATGATPAWRAAQAAWPANVELTPEQLSSQARLLDRLGRRTEAERILRRLAAMGYRHPAFVRA